MYIFNFEFYDDRGTDYEDVHSAVVYLNVFFFPFTSRQSEGAIFAPAAYVYVCGTSTTPVQTKQPQSNKFGSGDEKCQQVKWLNWPKFQKYAKMVLPLRNVAQCCDCK